MIKFFKGFVYHTKSALRSLFRHLPMTIMAVTAVMITLILITTFTIGAFNVSYATEKIENDVLIRATIDTTLTQEEIKNLGEKIKQLENVEAIEFVGKDEELEKMIKLYPNGEENYGAYRGENNPLRDVYHIKIVRPNVSLQESTTRQKEILRTLQKEISALDGIVRADYGGVTVENLVVILSRTRIIGFIVSIVLGLLAILLIQNTVKSAIHSRQNEITIMRHVGASNTFIKVPFMIEGVFIGILGSIVPISLIFLLYEPAYNILGTNFLIAPQPFISYVSIGIVLIGMVVGFIGATLSANKYLRFKR